MLSESDINLLDAYLDDALSASEVQSLDARLTEEQGLALSLDSLRAERKARAAALASFTPCELEAGRFSDAVIKSVRRREQTRRWTRNIRIGVSAAACLVIGFTVGWVGRGRGPVNVQGLDRADSQSVVQLQVKDAPTPIEACQFQVAVLDDKGMVVGSQRFKKIDDFRRFADDLAQTQTRPRQSPPSVATPGPKFTEPGAPRKMRYSEPGPAPVRSAEPGATQPAKSAVPPSTQPFVRR